MYGFLIVTTIVVMAPMLQGRGSMPSILEALRLPTLAVEARQAGASEAGVRDLLDRMQRRRLPAHEAAAVVREEVDALHAGAPSDTFGGFVQRQLEVGLRGQALADAIRVEHRTRGVDDRRPDGHPDQGQAASATRGRTP